MQTKVDVLNNFSKDRRHLINKYPEWKEIEITDDLISIPSPQLLAGFVGYLKHKLRNQNIYFRGEDDYYNTTMPSLFRLDMKEGELLVKEKIPLLYKAYTDLVQGVKTIFTAKRFKNDNIGPILQHYGIRTTWIDIVDNLFVSIWFSNHEKKNAFSYIKLLGEKWNNNKLQVSNLSVQYSSLSLRPHCQHGFSATKKDVVWNLENIDFSSNIIAVVKIPNDKRFWLTGEIFSNKYMFPEEKSDNTLKLLETEKFYSLANKTAQKYGLSIEEIYKKVN